MKLNDDPFFFIHSDGYTHSFMSDGGGSSSESSESEFEPGYSTSKQKKKRKKRKKLKRVGAERDTESPLDYVRTTGRSKGVISYKDFYDSDGGGSGSGEGEGLGGGEEAGEEGGGAVLVEDNREGIEKILKKRFGKIGGLCVY